MSENRDPATPARSTAFTRHLGIRVPLVCGAMYPCSNPELVAAVSDAGGIGVVQPLSMVYVHGHDLRDGLRLIRSRTKCPIGFNALLERTSRTYERRMSRWVDIALEEGVRFFVTALGNPRWVVDRVHAADGLVYHDVTARRWALTALDGGVDGLVCVNARAGGHPGNLEPPALLDELTDLDVPKLCAGGVGSEEQFVHALALGYDGVQMGTRFIATDECLAHEDYKDAIVRAGAEEIVLTDKLSGIDCSVIRSPSVDRLGTRAGPLARRLLRGRRTKRLMRTFYALRSLRQLRAVSLRGIAYRDLFLAGKSVGGIDSVEAAGAVVRRFAAAWEGRNGVSTLPDR